MKINEREAGKAIFLKKWPYEDVQELDENETSGLADDVGHRKDEQVGGEVR